MQEDFDCIPGGFRRVISRLSFAGRPDLTFRSWLHDQNWNFGDCNCLILNSLAGGILVPKSAQSTTKHNEAGPSSAQLPQGFLNNAVAASDASRPVPVRHTAARQSL